MELAHQWIVDNAPGLFPNPPRVTEGLVVLLDAELVEPVDAAK